MNETNVYELFFKHRYCFVRLLLFICFSVYTPDESKDSSLFTFQIGNKKQADDDEDQCHAKSISYATTEQ